MVQHRLHTNIMEEMGVMLSILDRTAIFVVKYTFQFPGSTRIDM